MVRQLVACGPSGKADERARAPATAHPFFIVIVVLRRARVAVVLADAGLLELGRRSGRVSGPASERSLGRRLAGSRERVLGHRHLARGARALGCARVEGGLRRATMLLTSGRAP